MMNRSEFMFQLAQLLADLSQAERSEALKYYQDYFDDAGPENEARIIEELISPEAVAASIKAGLSSEESDKGEFSERGFSSGYDETFDAPGQYSSPKSKFWRVKDEAEKKMNQFSNKMNDFSEKYSERFKNAGNTRQKAGEYRYGTNNGEGSRSGRGSASDSRDSENCQGGGYGNYGSQNGYGGQDSGYESSGGQGNDYGGYGSYNGNYGGYEYQEHYSTDPRRGRRRFSGGQIALIVLLAICASPILLGVFGGAVGLIFGVIGALVGAAAGLIGMTVGFIFGGMGGFISGAVQCFSNPALGIVTCGTSLIMIAVGALLLIVDIWFVTKPFPAFFRWLRDLWRRIFHRREQNI